MVDLLLLLVILVTGSIALLLLLRVIIHLSIDLFYLALRSLGRLLLTLAWLLEALATPFIGSHRSSTCPEGHSPEVP